MNFLARHTRRVLTAGLAASLALVVTPSVALAAPGSSPSAGLPGGFVKTATQNYTPSTGAIFNRPTGTRAEEMRIYDHLHRTIDSAPRRSTIRIAVYSFSRHQTADKLIAAHRRGVNVKLIVDNHVVTGAMQKLQRALGANRSRRSFIMSCERSCRGTGGHMHVKYFLFSRAGNARDIVMVGSNNLTTNNAVNQWSDLYTRVNDGALMYTFTRLFTEMAKDVASSTPYQSRTVSDQIETYFLPLSRPTPETDPLRVALSNVSCTAVNGAGVEGTSIIRIAVYAWNGNRGLALANQVKALREDGCQIRIVHGPGIGSQVKKILSGAGIPMKASVAKDSHVHTKYMFVRGNYAGSATSQRMVWMGSQNWSDGALRRDEVTMRVKGIRTLKQYKRHFAELWRDA